MAHAVVACGVPNADVDAGSNATTQLLGQCLVGWWSTAAGSCGIEPTCQQASGDLKTACSESDCASVTFFGHTENVVDGGAAYYQGAAVASALRRLFCSRDVATGHWRVVESSRVALSLAGGREEAPEANCLGDTAEIDGLARRRLASDLQVALAGRSAQGSWADCGY